MIIQKIYDNLAKSFEKEENELLKILLNLKLKNEFNPKEYGQHDSLIKCKFPKSVNALQNLQNLTTIFERAEQIRKVHLEIISDIKFYCEINKIKPIEICADVLISALMTILIESGMKNLIVEMLLLQYFLYVDYNITETSLMISNFIAAVKKLSQVSINYNSGIIEMAMGINIRDIILPNFFKYKKQEILAKKSSYYKKKAEGLNYVKQYQDYFTSDAETDENNNIIHK